MLSLSLITNIVLVITVLTLVFGPSLVKRYKNYKTKRETLRNDKIRKIVHDYLNELKDDT